MEENEVQKENVAQPSQDVAIQAKKMRKIGRTISVFMGFTLSLFLSLFGNLTSGHFSWQGWLISFGASLIISLIIGFAVPMKKVNDSECRRHNLDPNKFSTHLLLGLISDAIFTPIISIAMVLLAYFMATRQGAQLNLAIMMITSILDCYAVGYLLILIFTPLYTKLAFRLFR